MNKAYAGLLLLGSILASVIGVAAFIFLFARDFNVFTLILSPVIIACYQIPAVVLFWLYRRKRRQAEDEEPAEDSPHPPAQESDTPEN
jgi:Na+/H+ antiporter NhaD/arsenite permease-like protein